MRVCVLLKYGNIYIKRTKLGAGSRVFASGRRCFVIVSVHYFFSHLSGPIQTTLHTDC